MRAIIASLFSLALTGCVLNAGTLRVASSRNVRLDYEILSRGIEGKDCMYMFLFIPLGKLNPNIESAMNKAIAQTPNAEILVDVRLTQSLVFTYIINQQCVRVEGDAARLSDGL